MRRNWALSFVLFESTPLVLFKMRTNGSNVQGLFLYPGKRERGCTASRPQQRPSDETSPIIVPLKFPDNRPHVSVTLFDIVYDALLDTGAAGTFIGNEAVTLLNQRNVLPLVAPRVLTRMANGDIIPSVGSYSLEMKIGGIPVNIRAAYLPNLATAMVLGMDFLHANAIAVDIPRRVLLWHRPTCSSATAIAVATVVPSSTTVPLAVQSATVAPSHFTLTGEEEFHLRRFLKAELRLFDNVRGPTTVCHHRIRLKPEVEPIKQRYRPQNPRRQEIIDAEVDKMIEDGIIEPSDSPWSSPIVIVTKKDGTPRFCIDFQKVNDVTVKDAYPLPFINAILDKLRRARYISTLDLKQGYWQVPLTPDSKHVTAFTVPGRGLYQFTVMPFGLHSAPATFQRLMDVVIGVDLEPKVLVYLDDIIVLGESFNEHLALLREVFRRLRAANLQVNPEKCQFCRKSLKYLGHVVTPDGICTDPDKVESVVKYPPPTNLRTLRQFLGLISWYRRYIPSFSKTAAPLTRLLRKDQRWKWSDDQEAAFQQLKQALTEAPVLACPDFSQPFVLQTDASDLGLGAVLTQKIDDCERVIAYASRSLAPAEKNYSVTEKECLAIVWGVEKMRPYLEGYHFTVVTDHQSLKWLSSLKSPAGRLARWAMFLQQFDFEIKYRKGSQNRVADALSRHPLPQVAPEELYTVDADTGCAWYDRKIAEVRQNPTNFPDYCIREGRLYRHFWDSNDLTEPGMTDPWKLCLPKPSREAALRENHDEPTAGHLGIAKTIARLSHRYYWPGMFRDAAKHVRGCLQCQRYKVSQQQPPGKMQPSPNRYPWYTVSTDLVGPLPRSKKGNTFLVVFQDRFTKWTQCRAIRRASAKAVTEALYEDIICRFGCPRTVITDNGTQFDSRTFNSLLADLGIQHRFTPPYTPQANPVERANKTLKTMIAEFCEQDHRTWDQFLPELIFAINTARQESTGFSPAFLNFGRELDPPKCLLRSLADDPDATVEESLTVTSHFLAHLAKLRELYQLVRVNLARAFTTQSHHYNLRHREWKCHVGDKVMRREHPLSSGANAFAAKLAPKYSGPYTVCKVVSPVVYNLRSATGRIYRRIHIKDLKRFSEDDSELPQDS